MQIDGERSSSGEEARLTDRHDWLGIASRSIVRTDVIGRVRDDLGRLERIEPPGTRADVAAARRVVLHAQAYAVAG